MLLSAQPYEFPPNGAAFYTCILRLPSGVTVATLHSWNASSGRSNGWMSPPQGSAHPANVPTLYSASHAGTYRDPPGSRCHRPYSVLRHVLLHVEPVFMACVRLVGVCNCALHIDLASHLCVRYDIATCRASRSHLQCQAQSASIQPWGQRALLAEVFWYRQVFHFLCPRLSSFSSPLSCGTPRTPPRAFPVVVPRA